MKINILLLIFWALINSFVFTQVKFGLYQNIDVYKPYTSELQDYMTFNKQVKSLTLNLAVLFPIVKTEKIEWHFGTNLKKINFLVKDRVISYYEFADDGSGIYKLIHENLDFRSKSISIAILNDIQYLLSSKNKIENSIGLSNEIYLLEFFNAAYYYSGTKTEYDNSYAYISPLVSKLPHNFFLSSTNISIFYRLNWQHSEKFSLATKISLGTNLYSDWDQFKKYVWLGVGLELGFGNKPLFKQKEK